MLDHIGHRWNPDPELIPLIQQAFQMRASGSSLLAIHTATHLYSSLNSYKTFFTNRIYIGILEYGDLIVETIVNPLLIEDLEDRTKNRGGICMGPSD